jgi:hypothetical protein
VNDTGQAPRRAQGTIEYLVILSIVIVIALVLVALATNIINSPTQQILNSTNKLGSITGPITILDSAADSQGNALVRFSHKNTDTLTITKVNVDGVDNNFSGRFIGVDAKTLLLKGLLDCGDQKKYYHIIIYYQNDNGLQNSVDLGQIKLDCTEKITEPPGVIVTSSCFATGSGTLADPKLICDCNGLQDISLHTDWNYALDKDINCYSTMNWNYDGSKYTGFSPIQTFSGTLDGKNHNINGLYMNQLPFVDGAIVSSLQSGGKLSNFSLTNVNITGYNAGGLVMDNSGELSNISLSGTVTGDYSSAGLASSSNSGALINNCSVNATIISNQGEALVGGLVAWNNGNIFDSNASGTISGDSILSVGGLVGQNQSNGVISRSSASVNIDGSYYGPQMHYGGLVGTTSGNVIDSFASSNLYAIYSSANFGGLVGQSMGGDINNSYSSGTITCNTAQCTNIIVGGVIGRSMGRIFDSFTTTNISINPSTTFKGGFAGMLEYSWVISNSFFDINKTGFSTCDGSVRSGCTGKNNANTQPNYFFDGNNPPMGPKPTKWDFTTIWNDNNTTQQYPTLK